MFAAFHFNVPQAADSDVLTREALTILGGRRSIITPRSATQSPVVENCTPSTDFTDSLHTHTAFNFDSNSDATAFAPATQGDSNFEMSIFCQTDFGHNHQQTPNLSAFNMPSSSLEEALGVYFPGNETYTQSSARGQTFGDPLEEGFGATNAMWSNFAAFIYKINE